MVVAQHFAFVLKFFICKNLKILIDGITHLESPKFAHHNLFPITRTQSTVGPLNVASIPEEYRSRLV